MMMSQYFSPEGLEKLKSEYEERTTTVRAEIANRLKEAKDQGDLSENQEYSDAKEAQAMNEGRIEEIKAILEHAVLIDENATSHVITVGSAIVAKIGKDNREFRIVGASEADPANGLISNESPLGAAFIGHKKGDHVTVHTPKGPVEYTIVEIK
jgi:transcription elongation factor GreA